MAGRAAGSICTGSPNCATRRNSSKLRREPLSERMISLNGSRLNFDEFRRVAQLGDPVQIDPAALPAMLRSRAVVEKLALGDDPVYAVNTGVGLLADVRVPPEQLEQLQRNVVRSHACGVGTPLGRDEVRGMMLVRANVLAKGFS